MIKNTKHSMFQRMLNDRKEVVAYQYVVIKKFRKDINEFQEELFNATEETDNNYIDYLKDTINRFSCEIKRIQEYIATNEADIKKMKRVIKDCTRQVAK